MKPLNTHTASRVHAVWLFAALVVCGGAWAGDYVVIVNKANSNTVDKAMIAKIYTGETKSWGDGTPVLALDLPEDNAQRASFSSDVIGKTVSNLKALWAQMIFSGKAMPPKVVPSDDEVKKLVSANKGGVGYIKASSADDSVKIGLK